MKPKLGDCGCLQISEFVKLWNVIITKQKEEERDKDKRSEKRHREKRRSM